MSVRIRANPRPSPPGERRRFRFRFVAPITGSDSGPETVSGLVAEPESATELLIAIAVESVGSGETAVRRIP